MKKLISVLAGLIALSASGAEWRPSDALLRAVRIVESADGQYLYGDSGRSLGPFQLSEAAWADVSGWRKTHGLKLYSYRQYVMHDYINRVYAADYLALIHSELSRKLHREPSHGEIYAAYNMGLSRFADCGYRLAHVNPGTARKCRQVHALVALVEKG
jgi:hypothetical protein